MRCIPALLLLLYGGYTFGQSIRADSSFVAAASKKAIALYTTGIAGQSHLYNGNAYIEYQQQKEEHPYFIDEWIDGSVVYENELYQNVPLLYDINKDRLITDHQYNINKIQLISSKVKSFTLKQHQFVNLMESGIPPGFYELLYDGKTKVYAQWKKILQETITNQSIERRFDNKNGYYIFKDGKMIQVKSKKSVLHVFADQKSALRKMRGTRFKTDRARSIREMAQHYDQLQP